MDKPEQILEEAGFDIDVLQEEKTMLFRNPDYSDCICGVTYNNEVVYDYYKMILYLMEHENMTYDDAVEVIDHEASFGMSDYKMPIIMYPIKQD